MDSVRNRNWKHHAVELDDPSDCIKTILVILDVHFRLDSLRNFWNLNSSVCERECFKCHAAVVIVIQLGCDVIHEIQPITAAVISVLRQFEEWVSIPNIKQIKNDLSLIKNGNLGRKTTYQELFDLDWYAMDSNKISKSIWLFLMIWMISKTSSKVF